MLSIQIINWIFALAFAVPLALLLRRLIAQVFMPFMLNLPSSWDNQIDKPRIFFYLLFGGIAYVLHRGMKDLIGSNPSKFTIIVEYIALILVLFCAAFLHFVWTKRFANKAIHITEEITIKFQDYNSDCVLKTDESIHHVYLIITSELKYMECKLATFSRLVKRKPLKRSKPIIWKEKGESSNTPANRQTLFEFIIQLFPGLISSNRLNRQELKNIVETYFRDEQGNIISTDDSIISHWKKSARSTNEQLQIRKAIRSAIKNQNNTTN